MGSSVAEAGAVGVGVGLGVLGHFLLISSCLEAVVWVSSRQAVLILVCSPATVLGRGSGRATIYPRSQVSQLQSCYSKFCKSSSEQNSIKKVTYGLWVRAILEAQYLNVDIVAWGSSQHGRYLYAIMIRL